MYQAIPAAWPYLPVARAASELTGRADVASASDGLSDPVVNGDVVDTDDAELHRWPSRTIAAHWALTQR